MSNIYEEDYEDLLKGMANIYPETMIGKGVRIGRHVVIESGCRIGNNAIIAHGVVLRPETIIGCKTTIGHNCVFEGRTFIGDRCYIGSQSHITRDTIIEDDVFLGPMVVTCNTRRIIHGRKGELITTGPKIHKAVRIGAGAVILAEVHIGPNAQVGIGAVVTKDIPAGELWVGNPARFLRMVPEEEML